MDDFKNIVLNEIANELRKSGATEHDCALTKAFVTTSVENLTTYQEQLSNTSIGTPVIKAIADLYFVFS